MEPGTVEFWASSEDLQRLQGGREHFGLREPDQFDGGNAFVLSAALKLWDAVRRGEVLISPSKEC